MRFAGRWSTPPRAIINCASTYALSILEVVVHGNLGTVPPAMAFVQASIPDQVSRTIVDPASLPGWDAADLQVAQRFGNDWFDSAASAVLVVPSVLSPFEQNVLINHRHPDFNAIKAVAKGRVAVDSRLLR